jgi:lipopolysaccharide/colanic/teichoic acid biosynthesis glycosyltransferase
VGAPDAPEFLEFIAAVRLLNDPSLRLLVVHAESRLSAAFPRTGLEHRVTLARNLPPSGIAPKLELIAYAEASAPQDPFRTETQLTLRKTGVVLVRGEQAHFVAARGPRALASLLASLTRDAAAVSSLETDIARSSQVALANWAEALTRVGITAGDSSGPGLAPRRRLARPATFYAKHGKRWLDLALTVPLAALLSPAIVVTLASVAMTLGRPTVFRQLRPGLSGRVFPILKLRTMTDATDSTGQLLPDSQRLTRFGRFLRSASLDELPSVWNVIRGEMSLVGPRPLLVQYLSRYDERQGTRHDVRPGITGWAQVSGRNSLSWEGKFEADAWYVENLSLALDVRILLKTVRAVFLREGISADGHVTMPEFQGTANGSAA